MPLAAPEPESRRPPLARYLTRRLYALMLLGAGTLAVTVWFEYRVSQEELTTHGLDRLEAVASTLALQVDGRAHEALLDAVPARDGFTRWSGAPAAHREAHARFRAVEIENGLGTPIYSLRVRPAALDTVRAAPDRRHPDAMEFVVTSAVEPYWRHRYDYRPAMAPTLFEGRAAQVAPYTDEHGEWISAHAPIRDAQGRVVGLVSADTRLDELRSAIDMRVVSRWSLFTGIFAGLFGIVAFGAWRTIRTIGRLEGAAQRLGAGDIDTPIADGREGPAADLARGMERARAEAQQRALAEREARARLRFMARLSHEIRTPMNGVVGLTRLLEDGPLAVEQRRTLADISASAEHLRAVVDRLLDLSRLDGEAAPVEQAPFTLEDLLHGVAQAARPQLADGVELRVEVDPRLPARLVGDVVRLRQVLGELLANGARHTAKGRITLAAIGRPEGGRCALQLSVADTGCGIPPDAQADLFRPFSRLAGGEGVGLGLPLAAAAVRAMNGRITVHAAPGEGARFVITLDLGVAAPAAVVEADVELGGRCLVADDNPINRRVAVRTLHKVGARAEGFDDGDTAWAGLLDAERAGDPFDTLVLDLHMPRLHGIELVRRVRARPGAAGRLPIVMVSAGVDPEERAACLAAGADAFVAKPFAVADLRAAIIRCRGVRRAAEDAAVDAPVGQIG